MAIGAKSDDPHGSDDEWVGLTVGERYTLVFRGLADTDRWFVRTSEYVGVCAALAWSAPIAVRPGFPLTRELRVLVADGALSRDQIAGS